MKAAVEIEVKLPLVNASQGRKLLRDAGFEVHVKRLLERNYVLDDSTMSLRGSDRLLRVREAGGAITCTFKGPPQIAVHKQREEREFTSSSLAATIQLFEGLGFTERFRYEKYRTEFVQASNLGIATLDETPIGCFMELEGKPRWIDRVAKQLGYSTADYITASYGKLYFDWCAARGIRPSNFIFERKT